MGVAVEGLLVATRAVLQSKAFLSLLVVTIALGGMVALIAGATTYIAVSTMEAIAALWPHQLLIVDDSKLFELCSSTNRPAPPPVVAEALKYYISWAVGLQSTLKNQEGLEWLGVFLELGNVVLNVSEGHIILVIVAAQPQYLEPLLARSGQSVEAGAVYIVAEADYQSNVAIVDYLSIQEQIIWMGPVLPASGRGAKEPRLYAFYTLTGDPNVDASMLFHIERDLAARGSYIQYCAFLVAVAIGVDRPKPRAFDVSEYLDEIYSDVTCILDSIDDILSNYVSQIAVTSSGSWPVEPGAERRSYGGVTLYYDGFRRSLRDAYQLISFNLLRLLPVMLLIAAPPAYLVYMSGAALRSKLLDPLIWALNIWGAPTAWTARVSLAVAHAIALMPPLVLVRLATGSWVISIVAAGGATGLLVWGTRVGGVREGAQSKWVLILAFLAISYTLLMMWGIRLAYLIRIAPPLAPLAAILYWLRPLYPIGLLALLRLLAETVAILVCEKGPLEARVYASVLRSSSHLVAASSLALALPLVVPAVRILGLEPLPALAQTRFQYPVSVMASYEVLARTSFLSLIIAIATLLAVAAMLYQALLRVREFTKTRGLDALGTPLALGIASLFLALTLAAGVLLVAIYTYALIVSVGAGVS